MDTTIYTKNEGESDNGFFARVTRTEHPELAELSNTKLAKTAEFRAVRDAFKNAGFFDEANARRQAEWEAEREQNIREAMAYDRWQQRQAKARHDRIYNR